MTRLVAVLMTLSVPPGTQAPAEKLEPGPLLTVFRTSTDGRPQ